MSDKTTENIGSDSDDIDDLYDDIVTHSKLVLELIETLRDKLTKQREHGLANSVSNALDRLMEGMMWVKLTDEIRSREND